MLCPVTDESTGQAQLAGGQPQSARRHRRVPRARRDYYLTWLAVAFGVTVVATRLYLSITGYPQVGGGEIHLAHAVWGGLLLMASALWMLSWSHRGALTTAAILAGVGSGLFIDEIGKFITKDNNYFFPLAAPIIYVVGLALVSVILLVNRRELTADEHAAAAVERFADALTGHLTPGTRKRLQLDLEALEETADRPDLGELATDLRDWLDHHAPAERDRPSTLERLQALNLRYAARVPLVLLRIGYVVINLLLVVVGAVAAASIVVLWLVKDLPEGDFELQNGSLHGRGAFLTLAITAGLSLFVGVLAVRALYLMVRGRGVDSTNASKLALLVLLVGVNVVDGYTDIASVAVSVVLEMFALGWVLLCRWRIMNLQPTDRLRYLPAPTT